MENSSCGPAASSERTIQCSAAQAIANSSTYVTRMISTLRP